LPSLSSLDVGLPAMAPKRLADDETPFVFYAGTKPETA